MANKIRTSNSKNRKDKELQQLRKDFEAWLLTTEWVMLHDPFCTAINVNRPNSYLYIHVDLAWRAYQAMYARLKPRAYLKSWAMAEPTLSWNKSTDCLRNKPLYTLQRQKLHTKGIRYGLHI